MTPSAAAPPSPSLPDDVDAVVVTHRSEAEIVDCLAAIGAPHRTVVIDNASDDRSADLARAAGCRVIESGANLGFARAVDRAMALTSAPFVLVVNPDAVVDPGTPARLRRAMSDDVAVAGSDLRTPNGRRQRPHWPFPSAANSWREAFGLHRLRRPVLRAGSERTHAGVDGSDRSGPEPVVDVDSVVGACMLLSRTAWNDVGGFDARFWLYGEETDFCRRAADRGWRSVLVPSATCTHIGAASAARSPLARDHFVAGTDRFVLHHHGRAALVSHRIAVVVGGAIRWPLLAVLPGGATRRRIRSHAVRFTVRNLLTRPTTVPTVAHEATTTIVVWSLERWDEVWRRNQFLVSELVSDPHRPTRVLFVEPPVDLVHEWRTASTRTVLDSRPDRLARPVPGTPGVVTFAPRKLLPRVLGPWADRSLRRQVLRAVGSNGFGHPVLWINDAAGATLAARTDWPVVYDITDDWLHEGVTRREHRRRVRREDLLLRRSRRVVVCSPALAADRGRQRDVTLITNGVDVGAWTRPRPRPDDLPPGPVAVYVGTLHGERLDVDLVDSCAAALSHVQFVFVGPNCLDSDDTARLDRHRNVHLLGPRPFDTVPAYLEHAEVCIVAHVVTEFTESLDPIKAYECRAAGIPTVATPVAGFRDLPPPVRTAPRETFLDVLADEIDRAVTTARVRTPDRTVPTWTERAVEFRRELDAAAGPQRRRVVFVGHTARPGGGELALARLVPALRSVSCHVVLGEDGPLVDMLRSAGATVEVLPMSAPARDVRRSSVTWGRLPLAGAAGAAAYSIRLARRLHRLDADIVHTNTLKAALYGGVAARLVRIPVVWHVRDRIATDYLPGPAVVLVRWLAGVVPTAIIANSDATLATIGEAPRRSVIPSPVVHDAVEQHPGRRRIDPDLPARIVMVGRLAPWKGQHVFLRAFAAADLPDGTEGLLIGSALFGEDDYEAELRRLVDDLGLTGRVRFTGQVDRVDDLLVDADVLVHCSTLPEPFGQVVVEGLAAGLAVIASDAGGPAEVITDGIDGVLVPPGDVDGLAAALTILVADPGLRHRLGAAGRRRAGDFTPERIARMVDEVYDLVLDGNERR